MQVRPCFAALALDRVTPHGTAMVTQQVLLALYVVTRCCEPIRAAIANFVEQQHAVL